MQSANPSPRTWFLVVESEVCRKKGEILQEQEIAPSHPSGIRDREEGGRNCRSMWRQFLKNFSLWPCVALISSICGYIIHVDLHSLQENLVLKHGKNNAYPNIFLMEFQGNILAQLMINFNRSHKSHCYMWNSASNLFTRGPVLFLLPFKKPVKLAVILILETNLWSKFSSAFLLFDKSPFFQLSCFM